MWVDFSTFEWCRESISKIVWVQIPNAHDVTTTSTILFYSSKRRISSPKYIEQNRWYTGYQMKSRICVLLLSVNLYIMHMKHKKYLYTFVLSMDTRNPSRYAPNRAHSWMPTPCIYLTDLESLNFKSSIQSLWD